MKKTIILMISAISMLATGCVKEKQTGCPSPPIDARISWNDYNTVREMNLYFQWQPDTLQKYEGDTIKVKGWLYLEDSILSTWDIRFRLVGSEKEQTTSMPEYVRIGYSFDSLNIRGNQTLYHNELYLTGILNGFKVTGFPPVENEHCLYDFSIKLLDIKTMEK